MKKGIPYKQISLRLYPCSVYTSKIGSQLLFYLADVYTTNNKIIRIYLLPKSEMNIIKISNVVNSIVASKHSTKKIRKAFKVIALNYVADFQISPLNHTPIKITGNMKQRYNSLVSSLISYTKLHNEFSSPYAYLFNDNSNSEKEHCYVALEDNKIGYKYNNSIFQISIPKKKESIINITSDRVSLTLTASIRIGSKKIIQYGSKDEQLNKKIQDRLQMFEKVLGVQNNYNSFFKFLFQNRENVRIAPYYKMLFNSKNEEYEQVLSFVADKTLKVYLQPELLKTPVPKLNEKSSVLPNAKSLDTEDSFTYINYRETKGIYYTLSDEKKVLSEESIMSFNIIQLKKFAYIPRDILSKYFSFLSVSIHPANKRIEFKYYNEKWNDISLPIKIDQYTASTDTAMSGILKILWNIVVLVANRISSNERRPNIARKNTNSVYINREKQYINQSDMIELPVSPSTHSKSNVLVVNHRDLNKELSEKKMHYRTGHWHYYWYGSRKSPDRHKELKWVEETIVNREAENIIIVL